MDHQKSYRLGKAKTIQARKKEQKKINPTKKEEKKHTEASCPLPKKIVALINDPRKLSCKLKVPHLSSAPPPPSPSPSSPSLCLSSIPTRKQLRGHVQETTTCFRQACSIPSLSCVLSHLTHHAGDSTSFFKKLFLSFLLFYIILLSLEFYSDFYFFTPIFPFLFCICICLFYSPMPFYFHPQFYISRNPVNWFQTMFT